MPVTPANIAPLATPLILSQFDTRHSRPTQSHELNDIPHNPYASMRSSSVTIYAVLSYLTNVQGFTPSITQNSHHPYRKIISVQKLKTELNEGRYDENLERKAERKALQKTSGDSGGGALAGAVLGGLVLGPFGALFGASVGSKVGATQALDKAKQDELSDMGVTREMLESAREMGVALERGMEGLQATEDSLRTQQQFAKRLDDDSNNTYEDALTALKDGDETRAKDLLFKKEQIQEKLKKTLMNCVEEKKRLDRMKDNVRAIEERAVEMESLMKRNIGAKALIDSSEFSLAAEDPLLQKFRDMGID